MKSAKLSNMVFGSSMDCNRKWLFNGIVIDEV